MTTQHTPGPWHVEGDAIESSQRWVVASVHRFPDNDDTARPANARLIAAAPDLLALAHRYADECGECAGTRVMPDDEPCTECAFVWTVIDQAEGRLNSQTKEGP